MTDNDKLAAALNAAWEHLRPELYIAVLKVAAELSTQFSVTIAYIPERGKFIVSPPL